MLNSKTRRPYLVIAGFGFKLEPPSIGMMNEIRNHTYRHPCKRKTMRNTITRILLNTILLVILVLAAACQSSPTETVLPASPLDTPVPVQALAPTASPTPNANEASAVILHALLGLNSQPNRMEIVTSPEGGQAQTNVIEFVPPDRKHIASVEEGVEYIVIGEQVYAYTKSAGQWAETSIPAATFMGDQEITEATLAQTISEAQFVREDALDGKAVMVYSYRSTTQSRDIELHSQVELWVGKTDGLPCKMINDGEILAASTDPATGASKLQAVPAQTTTLITFDATLSIEPPVLSPTPAMVANPTTLRELVQGIDFVVGMKWFTDHPDTFDAVRNHSNGAHLTLFMSEAMPQQPQDLGNPASYDFSWIDKQVRGMNEEKSGTDSVYVSHVVVPHNINQ